jgi:hypothetical protein
MRRHSRFASAVVTTTLGLVGLPGCGASVEETRTGGAELVTDVESMHRRTDGLFDVVCRDGRREVVTAADVLADRVCGSGGVGTLGRVTIYGRSDHCEDRELVASIDEDTNCEAFSSSSPAWSIRDKEGRCQDIRDTNVRDACRTYSGRRPRSDLRFYDDRACTGTPLGEIAGTESCDTLPDSGPLVWGLISDLGCSWVFQTTLRRSCERFRADEDRR